MKATGKYLMCCQEDIKLFSDAAVSFAVAVSITIQTRRVGS